MRKESEIRLVLRLLDDETSLSYEAKVALKKYLGWVVEDCDLPNISTVTPLSKLDIRMLGDIKEVYIVNLSFLKGIGRTIEAKFHDAGAQFITVKNDLPVAQGWEAGKEIMDIIPAEYITEVGYPVYLIFGDITELNRNVLKEYIIKRGRNAYKDYLLNVDGSRVMRLSTFTNIDAILDDAMNQAKSKYVQASQPSVAGGSARIDIQAALGNYNLPQYNHGMIVNLSRYKGISRIIEQAFAEAGSQSIRVINDMPNTKVWEVGMRVEDIVGKGFAEDVDEHPVCLLFESCEKVGATALQSFASRRRDLSQDYIMDCSGTICLKLEQYLAVEGVNIISSASAVSYLDAMESDIAETVNPVQNTDGIKYPKRIQLYNLTTKKGYGHFEAQDLQERGVSRITIGLDNENSPSWTPGMDIVKVVPQYDIERISEPICLLFESLDEVSSGDFTNYIVFRPTLFFKDDVMKDLTGKEIRIAEFLEGKTPAVYIKPVKEVKREIKSTYMNYKTLCEIDRRTKGYTTKGKFTMQDSEYRILSSLANQLCKGEIGILKVQDKHPTWDVEVVFERDENGYLLVSVLAINGEEPAKYVKGSFENETIRVFNFTKQKNRYGALMEKFKAEGATSCYAEFDWEKYGYWYPGRNLRTMLKELRSNGAFSELAFLLFEDLTIVPGDIVREYLQWRAPYYHDKDFIGDVKGNQMRIAEYLNKVELGDWVVRMPKYYLVEPEDTFMDKFGIRKSVDERYTLEDEWYYITHLNTIIGELQVFIEQLRQGGAMVLYFKGEMYNPLWNLGQCRELSARLENTIQKMKDVLG